MGTTVGLEELGVPRGFVHVALVQGGRRAAMARSQNARGVE